MPETTNNHLPGDIIFHVESKETKRSASIVKTRYDDYCIWFFEEGLDTSDYFDWRDTYEQAVEAAEDWTLDFLS